MPRFATLGALLLTACSTPMARQAQPQSDVRQVGAAQLPAETASLAVPVQAEPQPIESSQIALSNRAFALELYRNLAANPGNIFISPISLAGAFGPVSAGAQGETRQAIARVLRFPASEPALHLQLGALLHSLESDSVGARVSIANALWLMRGIPLKPGFVAVAAESYGAEVANLDFRDGAGAAARINDWVARETNNRIRELIAADSLDEMTRVVVTNAVHFLGDWTEPFTTSRTRLQPFYLAGGGTRDVPMMSGERYRRLVEAGPVQLLELPYQGGRLALVAILPKKRGDLSAVEADLTDEQLGGWLQKLDSVNRSKVLVQLPKVQIESSYQLNGPLKELGMAVAFDRDRADFGGISDREQLFISQVVHKTFLRINEKGTEAGAATGVEIQAESSAEPSVFRADHPFLVLIRDKATGGVLFLGRIADPAIT